MPRAHPLPKQRGLAVAVQLALTFAAGMYAPRIRAQQIPCPPNGVAVIGAETNSVSCAITGGALTILNGGTLTNSGRLTNNGLGELTIEVGGMLENDSGGVLINYVTGFSGNNGGLNLRGVLKNNDGGELDNRGRLRMFAGSIQNHGALTNSGSLTVHTGGVSLFNYARGTLTNNASLVLQGSSRLRNYAYGTVTNNGQLVVDGATVRNARDGTLNNDGGTWEIASEGDLSNYGALNNRATLTIEDRGSLSNGNTGSLTNFAGALLVNRSNGFAATSPLPPLPLAGGLNNRNTLTNDGSLVNEGTLVNSFGSLTNNGLLSNGSSNATGRLYHGQFATLTNNGSLLNYAGAEFLNGGDLDNSYGASFYNFGTLKNLNYNAARRLANSGRLVNAGGGRLINSGRLNNSGYLGNASALGGPGGMLENSGTLDNSGLLVNGGNATLNNSGTLDNSGLLENFGTLANSGTLTNFGSVSSDGTFNSDGVINNQAGATFTNTGALTASGIRNLGTFVNSGSGVMTVDGQMENAAGASLNNSATLNVNYRLINDGAVVNSGTLNNNGLFQNFQNSTLTNSGTINNAASADLVVGRDATFTNGGRLNNAGRLYVIGGTITNNGWLENLSGGLVSISDGPFGPGALSNSNRIYNRAGATIDNQATLNNFSLIGNYGLLGNSGTLNNFNTLVNYSGATLSNSGTLTNGNQIINFGEMVNSGTIDNDSGNGIVNFTGATLTNSGTINNNLGSVLENHGTLHNDGLLNNTYTGELRNSGTLENNAGATLQNHGVLTNRGTLYNNAGATLRSYRTLNNNGYLINESGGVFTNAGTLNNNLSGIYGGIYNHGQLTNSGIFNNAAHLYNLNGATFTNSGTLNNTRIIGNDFGGTIVNTGTLNNHGTLANFGSLVNNGTLISNGTIVNGGTFTVASSVGGPLGTFTQVAGVLQGTASLTQAAVTINGGVLRPGAAGAPGELTITGNLTLGASATLEINATPATTSRVTVNGTANVAGSVELVAGAGTYPTTPQTILSATGGVTGTFSGVTTASAFLTPSLSYDSNTVFLSFYQSASFASVAMTPNQTAVSTLLGAIQTGGDADMQAAIGAISGMSAEQARAAYDSLAAAANTSAAFHLQFDLADGFVRTLTSRLGGAGSRGITAMLPVQVASAGAKLDLSSAAARDGAWVLGYGNHGKTDGDANASGYRQDGAGVAFGADAEFGERWRAGAAVNIGTQRAKLDQDAGKVTADGVSVAAYARYSGAAFTLDGMAGVGRNANESNRTVTVGGLSRIASADYDSDQQFAHLELTIKGWRLEPIAGLGYIRVDIPAYTETGAGGLSLAVDGQARESIKSYLGARYVHDLGGSLKLAARALWTHEFGDADSALAAARFTGAPAAGAFQTAGADLKRDGALLGIGLSGDWKRNLSLFGDVSVEARQGQWNAAAFAGVRYTW